MAKATSANLHDAERQWYSTRAGLTFTQNTPVNEMKRAFYAKTLASNNNQETLQDLEWRWLKTLTGVTGKYPADMWREAVVGAGGVPANSLTENKVKYFQLVV